MAILTTARFFQTQGAKRIAFALASTCVLGLGVSACVDLPSKVFKPPPVDLTSPIAGDIAAASAASGAYPKFVNVPATAPPDIRPGSAWSANTYDTLNLRRQQQALAALYPQTVFDTDGFASANRAKAVAPPPTGQGGQTDAYAKAQRERATPPSPSQ